MRFTCRPIHELLSPDYLLLNRKKEAISGDIVPIHIYSISSCIRKIIAVWRLTWLSLCPWRLTSALVVENSRFKLLILVITSNITSIHLLKQEFWTNSNSLENNLLLIWSFRNYIFNFQMVFKKKNEMQNIYWKVAQELKVYVILWIHSENVTNVHRLGFLILSLSYSCAYSICITLSVLMCFFS